MRAGLSRRRRLILIGGALAAVAYYGGLLVFHQLALQVTPAERELLQRDYSSLIEPLVIPIDESKPDPGNQVGSARGVLQRTGLKLSDLTPAERVFVGRVYTPQGTKGYHDICREAHAFLKVHRRMPRNAAELVLAHPDHETYILEHPVLVNPATGRLYESFKSRPAPLGLRLRPGEMRGLSGISAQTKQRWGIVVYREDGKSLLLNTEIIWH